MIDESEPDRLDQGVSPAEADRRPARAELDDVETALDEVAATLARMG